MDIRTKAVSATGRLHLRDAAEELLYTTEPTPREVAVNVYGPGSKQYAKAQAAQQNRAVDMLKRKGKTDQTAEQRRRENAEFLADCTESFENLEYDGLTGRELALAVYSDPTIGFIADQVAKHIGDWSNFSKPAATN
jgi:hypothetical protein